MTKHGEALLKFVFWLFGVIMLLFWRPPGGHSVLFEKIKNENLNYLRLTDWSLAFKMKVAYLKIDIFFVLIFTITKREEISVLLIFMKPYMVFCYTLNIILVLKM